MDGLSIETLERIQKTAVEASGAKEKLDIIELPPEAQARLASIEVVRERTHRVSTDVDETSVRESTVKIKVCNKLRSLELLGRHLGMFKDKVEHGADFSLLDTLRRLEAKEDAARQPRPT